MTTMQALSGAGYPGVPSLAITENVIPYIKNEEEKVAKEAKKILGTLTRRRRSSRTTIPMGISCNRVPVIDGHTETLYAEFPEEVDPQEAAKVLAGFRGEPQKLKLPTAPERPIIVRTENDRPQPRLDRMAGSVPGMSVTVGRLRNGIDRKVAPAHPALPQHHQGGRGNSNPYGRADGEGRIHRVIMVGIW